VAGATFGVVFGLGLTVGLVISGLWADRLARRGLWRPILLACWGNTALAICYVAVLWLPSLAGAIGATFVVAMLTPVYIPATTGSALSICDPRLRATLSALQMLISTLFGAGMVPLLIGVLSDALHPTLGAEALRVALTMSLAVCATGAWVFWQAARSMVRYHNDL
jgi:MFS family permease